MKSTKQALVAGLAGAAVLWVSLMSLLGSAPASIGPSVFTFIDDGSIKAKVTNLDKQQFEISLSLQVQGKDGKVFGGLEEKDFEVREDGQVASIKKFVTAGQQPVRAALVIDQSGSMSDDRKLEGAKDAALAFIGLLRDNVDYLGLVVFESNIRDILPVGQLDASRRGLAKQEIERLQPRGGTELYPAMRKTLDGMEKVTGRRLLLVLTDGIDNRRDPVLMAAILDQAKRLNVPLYMVGLGPAREIDEPAMRKFADETKGVYLHAPTAEKLKEIYSSIGKSIQDEYALTYDSPNPVEDGLTRKVDIAMRSGGTGTRAKSEYHVPGVLSAGGGRKPPTSGTPAESVPFLGVFIPLAGLLGLLFGIPYAMVSRGASSAPPSAVPAAPAMPVHVAKPASASPVPIAMPAPAAPVPPQRPTPIAMPAPARPAVPLPPPRPAPAPAAQSAPVAGVCPTCKIPAPGVPGKRRCMICGAIF